MLTSLLTVLNPFHSVYTKKCSTENTLLLPQDRLSNAISHQQLSCLYLLDISTAFDNLDHHHYLTSSSFYLVLNIFSIHSVVRTHLPLPLSSFLSLFHSHLWYPSRLRFWPYSFQSLYHPSQFSHYSSAILQLFYADDLQLFISFIHKNI